MQYRQAGYSFSLPGLADPAMSADCPVPSSPLDPTFHRGIKKKVRVSRATGIHNRLEPGCLEAKLDALHDTEDKPNRTNLAVGGVENGASAVKDRPIVERLWQSYFEDPTQWWDNRSNKFHPQSPDFRHKRTKDGIWINSQSTPTWVIPALERSASSKKAGRVSLHSGSASQGAAGSWKDGQRDVFYWTARISEYNKCGQCRLALRAYEEMRAEGVEASTYTFVAILKACSGLQDLECAKRIHAKVVTSGLESDVYVGTMLVDVYAKCGSLVDAKLVFEKIPHRDVVSWNAMILGYAQMNEGEVALGLYAEMRQEGVVPNGRTFVAALKACSNLAACKEVNNSGRMFVMKRWLERVRAIHTDVVKGGFESDLFVGNMLVDVYTKCGSLADARCVFEKIPSRTVVSWTAMILGYATMDKGEEALQLFKRMQLEAAVAPNERTFVAVLKACSSLAAAGDGYETDGLLEQVKGIHLQVQRAGCESDIFVGTMLVDVYAKCRSLGDARLVFEKMPLRNVVSWTAMILGYVQMEQGDAALQLYAQMQQEGVLPNERTFVAALKACGGITGLEKGKEIHAQILESGNVASGSFVASGLIDMYGKCGSMAHAQQVFDALPERDAVTWSALMAGYACQGESTCVFDLFDRSRQEGIHPDGVTFLSLLTVCSHHGLLDKGQLYFEVMTSECGITPAREHYSCMIDLLGRAGLLDSAMNMVETMPFKPSGTELRSVLGACQKWGNVELGRKAFERAVRLNENDAAAYSLMINIYVAADMLEDAKKVQAMRVTRRAWKQSGQSWWSDMGGTVHTFAVGDVEHPRGDDINIKLRDVSVKMNEEGLCCSS